MKQEIAKARMSSEVKVTGLFMARAYFSAAWTASIAAMSCWRQNWDWPVMRQAAAGFDGDRDRLLVVVAGIGEQLQQCGEPGGVVADSAFGHQLALGGDQGDVVMVFGPVDATEHSQDLDPPRELAFRAVQSSRQGHARALMAGLEARHPTSRS